MKRPTGRPANHSRECRNSRSPAFRYARLFARGAFLLLLGRVCVSAQVGPAPGELLPLNPEFVEWQQKAKMVGSLRLNADGRVLGRIPSPFDWSHLESQRVPSLMFRTAPARFDLRDNAYVSPVRNQANCGCCWAFGTYGALESSLLMQEGESWDFSENHLKNHHGFGASPCEGGNEHVSIAYLARWAGPVTESDDPYHDRDDRPSPGGPCRKYVTSVLRYSSREEIKNAVMNHGAVHAWMYVDDPYYDVSAYTYYYDGNSDEDDTENHDVTIVGWDDHKSVAGAPGRGAWIAKNSWGTGFGEDGYFYISYYDAKAVTQAIGYCDAVPPSAYQNNYQYDPLGPTRAWGGRETAWGANVFTAKANESLSAVGFHATAKNTSYEIDIYDRCDGGVFSELLGSTSGTLTYPGYHTVALPSPVSLNKDDVFAIVVKCTTPGHLGPVSLEMPIDGYSPDARANPGESYISRDGVRFTDVTDEFPNTNVCIKGLTVPCDDEARHVLQHSYIGGNDSSVRATGDPWTIATCTQQGAGLWGFSDRCHFAHMHLSGDGYIIARLSIVGPDPVYYDSSSWCEAGVMIRQTLDTNAKYATTLLALSSKGETGWGFQWRQNRGGGSASYADAPAYARWVKLVREGDAFSGYLSDNGQTWDQIGRTVTTSMDEGVYIGLTLTASTESHPPDYERESQEWVCTFDNVEVVELP